MSAAEQGKELVNSALGKGVDKATALSRSAVLAHIERCRRARPDAPPADVIKALGRHFTAGATGTGTAAGATAAAPGVTLPVSLTLALTDATGFIGMAALYVYALTEIYDIPVDDLERRRTLLLGVLVGDAGTTAIHKVAGRTGPHWARQVVKAIPASSLRAVNKVLGHNFVTRYGARQGVLVLGKQVPLGIGAAIGGIGNATMARLTIRAALRAFGPAPTTWPASLSIDGPDQPPLLTADAHADDGVEIVEAELVDEPLETATRRAQDG